MCDVPSIADFCSEFIECFPGMAFKIFFKPFVTTTITTTTTTTTTTNNNNNNRSRLIFR